MPRVLEFGLKEERVYRSKEECIGEPEVSEEYAICGVCGQPSHPTFKQTYIGTSGEIIYGHIHGLCLAEAAKLAREQGGQLSSIQ